MDHIKKEVEWSKERTNRYLCRYDIKKEIGRFKSQIRRKKSTKQANLNETEKLVVEKLEDKIKVLNGYGADFLHQERNVIEVKKRLHKYNIKHAILQLIYAKDILQKIENLRIYTKKNELTDHDIGTVRRLLNYYNIDNFVYDSKKNEFIKEKIW